MRHDLQIYVDIAINQYVAEVVQDYLEAYAPYIEKAVEDKKTPVDVVNLVLTLKHWANPKSNYPYALPDKENINFEKLQQMVDAPRHVVHEDKSITDEDEIEIGVLLRHKLDQSADVLIEKYKLESLIKKRAKETNAATWWNSKSAEEQHAVQIEYENLSSQQKQILHEKIKSENIYDNAVHSDVIPEWYLYFSMYHWHSYLYGHSFGLPFLDAPIISIPHTHDADNGNGSSGRNELLETLGFLAVAASGIGGGIYAAKKAANSLINFFTGNKMLSSAFRLASIGGGAYLGVVEGMLVGAALGSSIPGLGTVAGAVLGGFFGLGLGAGGAAFISKYISKAISTVRHVYEINPSNPEKYQLTIGQENKLKKGGFDLKEIDRMIRAIHYEKSKIGFSGSFPFTAEREKKNQLNDLLKKIKNGEIEGRVKIGNWLYDAKLSRFDHPPKVKYSTTANVIMPAMPISVADFKPEESPAMTAPRNDDHMRKSESDTPALTRIEGEEKRRVRFGK